MRVGIRVALTVGSIVGLAAVSAVSAGKVFQGPAGPVYVFCSGFLTMQLLRVAQARATVRSVAAFFGLMLLGALAYLPGLGLGGWIARLLGCALLLQFMVPLALASSPECAEPRGGSPL